jgi:hypothetical protein
MLAFEASGLIGVPTKDIFSGVVVSHCSICVKIKVFCGSSMTSVPEFWLVVRNEMRAQSSFDGNI